MAVIESIISALTGNLGTTIKGILDQCITTEKEKIEAQAKIDEVLANYSQSLTNSASEVIKTEEQGGILQRNWRPILMLMFGFILIYQYFIAPTFNLPTSSLPDTFWNLLEIGIGGYVIGRTAEKITDKLVQ